MIVINFFIENDCEFYQREYICHISGIINDCFDIHIDPDLIDDCLLSDDNFNPKHETLYELYLTRGLRAADPVPEPCFVIDKVVEKIYRGGDWITPYVQV